MLRGLKSPHIQIHSEGEKSQGFGDRVPYSTKKVSSKILLVKKQKKGFAVKQSQIKGRKVSKPKTWYKQETNITMANLGQISNKVDVEINKISTLPICSNNETFDTTNLEKSWKNKRRRKFVSQIIADRLQKHEWKLPKNERGAWNKRIAYEYVPRLDETGQIMENKYGETLYEPTEIEKKESHYYNHLDNTGNQLRWKRLKNCLSEIKEAVDHTTGEIINKATYKCNDKLCGNCSQIRSIVAVTKYKNKVKAMTNPVMVVLHQKSPGIGELKGTIDAMYKDWRTIMKLQAKSNRESFNGICALEVTTNETDKTFHPHYHIVIEKHQAIDLVNKWLSADPINRKLKAHTNKATRQVYSELPKDDKGNFTIKELFKYAMKMSVTNQEEPGNKLKTIGSTEMIYEIAKALKSVQQWRPFGNFRETPNTKEITKAIQDEMMISPREWPHIQLSKVWKWTGIDWEAFDIPGLYLIGEKLTKKNIAFLLLNQQEINKYVNEQQR